MKADVKLYDTRAIYHWSPSTSESPQGVHSSSRFPRRVSEACFRIAHVWTAPSARHGVFSSFQIPPPRQRNHVALPTYMCGWGFWPFRKVLRLAWIEDMTWHIMTSTNNTIVRASLLRADIAALSSDRPFPYLPYCRMIILKKYNQDYRTT